MAVLIQSLKDDDRVRAIREQLRDRPRDGDDDRTWRFAVIGAVCPDLRRIAQEGAFVSEGATMTADVLERVWDQFHQELWRPSQFNDAYHVIRLWNKIARREIGKCRARLKQEHENRRALSESVESSHDAPEVARGTELWIRFWEAVEGLEEQHREAIEHRVFNAMTFSEVGDLLGMSAVSALNRFERACKQLKAKLRDCGITEEDYPDLERTVMIASQRGILPWSGQ